MKRILAAVSLVAVCVASLTGCGPTEEELAAIAASDTEACVAAMKAFDGAQTLLDDGITPDDTPLVEGYADDLEVAAGLAGSEEIHETIGDAARGLRTWAKRSLPVTADGLPLYVDTPMFFMEARCEPSEDE